MGHFFWCYQRVREGELIRLAARVYDPFLRGEVPLSAGQERCVRLVFLSGSSESRHAVEVQLLDFVTIEVDEAGFHNERLQQAAMRDAVAGLDITVDEDLALAGVVDARARFEQRRYSAKRRWKPTATDKAALAELVNHRARRSLL